MVSKNGCIYPDDQRQVEAGINQHQAGDSVEQADPAVEQEEWDGERNRGRHARDQDRKGERVLAASGPARQRVGGGHAEQQRECGRKRGAEQTVDEGSRERAVPERAVVLQCRREDQRWRELQDLVVRFEAHLQQPEERREQDEQGHHDRGQPAGRRLA
ncbi:hypothetical protein ACVWW5_001172 [Bradyrhizobium sp. LM3.4]